MKLAPQHARILRIVNECEGDRMQAARLMRCTVDHVRKALIAASKAGHVVPVSPCKSGADPYLPDADELAERVADVRRHLGLPERAYSRD
jgi:hypothetical protein